jgi:hypothetical protein
MQHNKGNKDGDKMEMDETGVDNLKRVREE